MSYFSPFLTVQRHTFIYFNIYAPSFSVVFVIVIVYHIFVQISSTRYGIYSSPSKRLATSAAPVPFWCPDEGAHAFSDECLAAYRAGDLVPGLFLADIRNAQIFRADSPAYQVSKSFPCNGCIFFPFFAMVETSGTGMYQLMGHYHPNVFFSAAQYILGYFNDIGFMLSLSFFLLAASQSFLCSGIYS